jgi:uncharacterized protein (DUF983 family)
VRTGQGCRDCGADAMPDRIAADLPAAVDIILAGGVQP